MNRGEPSDDLSKIRGGSSVVVTPSLFHGLIHVPNAHTGKFTPWSGTWGVAPIPNAHTGKFTPWSGTWGVAPINPFFLVQSGGCGHTCADYR
nr:putative sugar phosphate/phosphate translocator [Ipomoea batatas]